MTKFKVQRAIGEAVTLNQWDRMQWSDHCTGYHGMTWEEAKRDLIDALNLHRDASDEIYDHDFELAYDDATALKPAEAFETDGAAVVVANAGVAIRIVEDEDARQGRLYSCDRDGNNAEPFTDVMDYGDVLGIDLGEDDDILTLREAMDSDGLDAKVTHVAYINNTHELVGFFRWQNVED